MNRIVLRIAAKRGSLHLAIRIPKTHLRHRHGAEFVSPSTQSMSIAVTRPTNVSEAVGLTVSSGHCRSTLASTLCSLTVPGLVPGNGYTASVSTYDGPVSGGSNAATATFVSDAGPSTLVALTADSSGNVFTFYCGTGCSGAGTLAEFRPPYTGSPTATTSSGIAGFVPQGLRVDAAGDLFVGNCPENCASTASLEFATPLANGASGAVLGGSGGPSVDVLP